MRGACSVRGRTLSSVNSINMCGDFGVVLVDVPSTAAVFTRPVVSVRSNGEKGTRAIVISGTTF